MGSPCITPEADGKKGPTSVGQSREEMQAQREGESGSGERTHVRPLAVELVLGERGVRNRAVRDEREPGRPAGTVVLSGGRAGFRQTSAIVSNVDAKGRRNAGDSPAGGVGGGDGFQGVSDVWGR
jgi:hypothetical protein